MKSQNTLMISYQNTNVALEKEDFSSQHCLLVLIEEWKTIRDKGVSFGALLTGLLKAFGCHLHDLLIAKLHTYGFDMSFLKLVSRYLVNGKQRVKINDKLNS